MSAKTDWYNLESISNQQWERRRKRARLPVWLMAWNIFSLVLMIHCHNILCFKLNSGRSRLQALYSYIALLTFRQPGPGQCWRCELWEFSDEMFQRSLCSSPLDVWRRGWLWGPVWRESLSLLLRDDNLPQVPRTTATEFLSHHGVLCLAETSGARTASVSRWSGSATERQTAPMDWMNGANCAVSTK